MNNLALYDKVRSVPSNAVKPIGGGRLKGMSDINPMWRIKTLTEQFGICGIGWKYIIKKCWIEQSPTNEVAAFVEIGLYIKQEGEWSEEIPGTGGSMFVTNEKNGAYTNDECYKMALTDALSVACKSLGIGADVYWDKDSTKYSKREDEQQVSEMPQQDEQKEEYRCSACGAKIMQAVQAYSMKNYGKALCRDCQTKAKKGA